MRNKILSLAITLILSSAIIIFSTNKANAHKSKNHKPTVCIPESERTKHQLQKDKFWNFQHRLSKLQTDCLIVLKEKFGKELKILEEKLRGVAECGDIPFNHKANKRAKIYLKADLKSKVIAEVKKDDELLFFSTTKDDESWYYVKVKKENSCTDGYIKAKYVVKKEEATDDKEVVVKKAELIKILKPKLQKNGKLMIIDAEGTLSITGAVTEGKIDEILINEEEEVINDDNTFTYLLFVSSEGAEIRIIGKNNGEVVKELSFKIKVGK